jgi:hypothetical protein
MIDCIAILCAYLLLGIGIWIGQRVAASDEEVEPIPVELAIALLTAISWPMILWSIWKLSRREREFD